ncbi:MAG: 16S rRNA (adenine(1518)-N(6)/adenine(1519)-N(6))-dimethyltransferase RsmA [Pseudomonadota bacterium]
MRARKRFGQHFLNDAGVLDRLVAALNLAPEDRLLEIGPGRGALTERLYGHTAEFRAVEIDRDLVPLLKARFPELKLVCDDVLRVNLADLLQGQPHRVVGNLPYNISTPLLERLFALGPLLIDAHLMLQKEVADRLVAEPRSKAYGRLSVAAQVRSEIYMLFEVAPSAFSPPPAVDSAIIALRPRPQCPAPVELAALDAVLRQAFQQRRKRLGNALKTYAVPWESLGLDPELRPDQLDVDAYLSLAIWSLSREPLE